ncbi:unnamed protein product [Brassica oleracea var. botrytis]|uniref:(rape) hypothetical protein n=1 Tax=Brassica napus TaxID=3708 RepID=A0A816IXX5_BRANA|nr:unnamed protein product [Brassica napus]
MSFTQIPRKRARKKKSLKEADHIRPWSIPSTLHGIFI